MPSSLAAAFLERLPSSPATMPADLDELLADVVATARQAWPGIDVDLAAFGRYLADRVLAGGDSGAAIRKLDAAGLWLACAAVAGNTGALAAFDAILRQCAGAVARIDSQPAFVDEVTQIASTKLFVAHAGELPRIVDYAGTGDVRSFVRVVLVREALDQKRKLRRETVVEDPPELASTTWASADPELSHLRARYGADLENVFRAAIAELTSEERNLLRYHYLDRLSIDHLGAIYGIHRVSAARRLTKVRQTLVASTRRLFSETLRLRTGEVESVLRLIESDVDFSLRSALGEKKSKS